MILSRKVTRASIVYGDDPVPEIVSIDTRDIRTCHANNQKINLIKEYRRISGMGLKDSKDIIEKYWNNVDDLVNEFKRVSDWNPQLTRDEFIILVNDALDGAEKLYYNNDYIEIMKIFIKNIEEQGGLKAIAEKREEFLRSL